MVRHNNMLPFGHFHKKWQGNLKLWFNQPMKKKRRHLQRVRKCMRSVPKPVYLLRPAVRCPSIRYNRRVRAGRGFTLQELKQAKINKHYARTIGISVDHRRTNRSVESLYLNKQRLLDYTSKLILNPKPTEACMRVSNKRGLIKVNQPVVKTFVKVPTDEEKKFSAFNTLRVARSQRKRIGKKLKKKLEEDELLKFGRN